MIAWFIAKPGDRFANKLSQSMFEKLGSITLK